MSRVLEVQGLTLAVNGHVLVKDLSLTVRTGRVTALVGSSGSGKSMTCLGMLDQLPAGVTRVSGHVLCDGQRTGGEHLRGRQVSMIMQNPRSAFNPVLTMRAHAYEVLALRNIRGADAQARLDACLVDVGLNTSSHVLDLYSFQISGGMLQRMMIALALLAETPFLLADEPTTDLDLLMQARVLDVLDRLVEEKGLGILLVTHDMGVVARCAHDVLVMDEGSLVEATSVEQLFEAPCSPAARDLLAAHQALTLAEDYE
ncbi:ATP-binding cassette domain-containing protein [Pseudomonas sp.]|uniref:ATP-binding cassette domain-containing protein n=1 Tax=Pseudomonas sp. TaxID=306 RepID=UPI002896CCA5|nr:ATP-binding cassette domain-containing protein [Pseudomonas sp.]